MVNFDAKLKKVLEVDFKDYNDNQKVLKHAIRKTILDEIWPVFEALLKDMRNKKLEEIDFRREGRTFAIYRHIVNGT